MCIFCNYVSNNEVFIINDEINEYRIDEYIYISIHSRYIEITIINCENLNKLPEIIYEKDNDKDIIINMENLENLKEIDGNNLKIDKLLSLDIKNCENLKIISNLENLLCIIIKNCINIEYIRDLNLIDKIIIYQSYIKNIINISNIGVLDIGWIEYNEYDKDVHIELIDNINNIDRIELIYGTISRILNIRNIEEILINDPYNYDEIEYYNYYIDRSLDKIDNIINGMILRLTINYDEELYINEDNYDILNEISNDLLLLNS